jgi:hypothetical protein
VPPLGEPPEEGACEELVRVVTGAPEAGGLPVDGALDVACEALVRVVTAPVPLAVAGVEPEPA